MDNKKLELAERAVEETETSKQPRFNDNKTRDAFLSVFSTAEHICDKVPQYKPDSRKRDTWLSQFVLREPLLISVINSAVQIDANRGWVLIGGRNQVRRFSNVLKNYHSSPGTSGWRNGVSATSRSFYTTDINALVEVGRDGENGPLAGLFHVDPTLCRLTGNNERPLAYDKTKENWLENEYFRVASLPSIREKYNGLGYCAVSRCLQLAITAWAIHTHDQEQLSARAPQGLLLMLGITEEQWNTAMATRDADLNSKERRFYGGVSVLASSTSDNIDAKLISLSQLPSGFNKKEWVDLLMYGYALSFGYDASEFWPVQFGSLGRGNEAAVQSEKASEKGGLSFALGFQDSIQQELPASLHFEFEERSDSGDLLAAEVNAAKADWIKTLSEMKSGDASGEEFVYSSEEIKQLSATQGLIPVEWTDAEEASVEDDEGKVRDRLFLEQLRENPYVRNAVERFPDDPLIKYIHRPGVEREVVICQHGSQLFEKRIFQSVEVRQDDNILFESDDGEVVITVEDVDRSIENTFKRDEEMGEMITAESIE